MRSETCKKLQAPITRTLIATAVSACFVPLVFALPLAPGVVNGSASFVQNGNTLTVTNSNQAIINWQSFSIGSKEITRFVQPSANSSVLNRVLGNDPSQLLGALQSNGRVFLINPAGVLVGQGARVDVAGFAASTLNLSNSDFLASRLRFTEAPGAGKVQNLGEITTPSGGNVYLVAPQVENGGIISAPNGEVLLAAGQRVELIDTATPGVRVAVVGSEGNATNLGTITAEAGRIGIAGVLVKNSGTLNASSVVSEGGRIFLKASGDTLLSGDSRISATGAKGGNVEVLGQRVALTDHARIDASGQNGGGSVLVGGDYQGKNAALQNSQITYFGKEASIQADALENGDGGKVIVWADDTTRAYGSISARGGALGGNGGNAEVSGKSYLDFKGTVDLSAKSGVAGTLLLDPANITIGANADLNGDATLGDDVTTDVLVGDNPAATSQITAAQVGTLLNTTSLSLAASNDITVSSAINKTANTANITLTLNAGNAIALNAPISAAAGGLSVELMAGAGGISQTAGIVTADKLKITSNGNVNLTEGNLVGTLAASMSAGSLSFSNAQSLEIAGIGGTNGIIFTGNSSPINISTSAGDLTLYEPILADGLGGGMITLTAANAIDLQAAITASNNLIPAGPVKLTAGAGGITGNAFSIITADGLAVRSGGNVALDTAVNMVDKLAASVSGTNSDFKFVNGKALKVDAGAVVDNLTGISLTGIVGDYDSVTPNGVISLRAVDSPSSPTAWYSITQSAGALLAGKAVHAIGSTVDLQAANPTGVIAGKATGGSFKYKSSSPIFVTSVGGSSGIQNTGIGGDIVLTSTNGGIGQDQPISTKEIAGGGGFGLSLSSTADVMLQNASNNFAVLSANVSAGSLAVYNSENFTVGTVNSITGINTNNTNIMLAAGTGKTLTISATNPISAGASGSVSLEADLLVLGDTVTAGIVDIRPFTAGRKITVGKAICSDGDPCLNVTNLWNIVAPTIGIGTDAAGKASGAIYVDGLTVGGILDTDRNAATTRIGLLSGAGVTQNLTNATANAINVQDLGVVAGDDVLLTNAANVFTNLAAKNTVAGKVLSFDSNSTVNVTSMSGGAGSYAYSLSGIATTGGGNIGLKVWSGDLNIPSKINAAGGTVTLNAAGSIYSSGVAPNVIASILDVQAGVNIGGTNGLQTQAGRIDKLIATAGYIDVLNLGGVIVGPAVANAATVVNAGGDITIKAMSPLTINGGVTSSAGNISLTASAGDTLSINAPVAASSGTIALAAGALTGSVTVPSASFSNNTPASGGGGGSAVPPPTTLLPPPQTIVPPPTTLLPPPETVVPPPTTLLPPPATLLPPPLITIIATPTVAAAIQEISKLNNSGIINTAAKVTDASSSGLAKTVPPMNLLVASAGVSKTMLLPGTIGGTDINSFGGNELIDTAAKPADMATTALPTPAGTGLAKTVPLPGSIGSLDSGNSFGGSGIGAVISPMAKTAPSSEGSAGNTVSTPAARATSESSDSGNTSKPTADSKSGSDDKSDQKSKKEATDDAKVAKKKPAQCT